MTEKNTFESKELPSEQPSFNLIVARHAAYYDPRSELAMKESGVSEDEIRSKIGHLTESGKEQARDFGINILDEVVADGGETDITFIASTQPYDSPAYPDAEWSGRRAEETSDEAVTAIIEKIHTLEQEGELLPGQVRVATPRPEKPFANDNLPNDRLIERKVYYPVNQLGESMISRYRARTEQVLDDEAKAGVRVTGGYSVPSEDESVGYTNFDKREKELWSRGEQDIDRFAAAMSAETADGVADRVMSVADDMNELARLHSEREPGRKLVVVLVSHDAVVGAVTSKGMGAENPVIPSYMDRIDIAVNDAVASFEQDGTIYERQLSKD